MQSSEEVPPPLPPKLADFDEEMTPLDSELSSKSEDIPSSVPYGSNFEYELQLLIDKYAQL